MARLTNAERITKLGEEKRRIEVQLVALQARRKTEDRKRDARRKIIVGGAVLAKATEDAGFRQTLRSVLATTVLREGDKAAIADLMSD